MFPGFLILFLIATQIKLNYFTFHTGGTFYRSTCCGADAVKFSNQLVYVLPTKRTLALSVLAYRCVGDDV